MENTIDKICFELTSKKVTDRRRGCDSLLNLLTNTNAIPTDISIKFQNIISAIQECLIKVAEREQDKSKTNYSDLLYETIKFGIKNEIRFNIQGFVGYIIGCLKNEFMRNSYEINYLCIMVDCVLPSVELRSQLAKEDWQNILETIREVSLLENSSKNLQLLRLNCMLLIIRYGVFCGLSLKALEDHFGYMNKLGQSLDKYMCKDQIEDGLELILLFCQNASADYRTNCCLLGEQILLKLVDLFEINSEKIKMLIIEIFLLQVTIHHPFGASTQPLAYSSNWSQWKSCLRRIYFILTNELNDFLKNPYKPNTFFKNIKNNSFIKLYIEVCRQLILNEDLDISTLSTTLQEPLMKKPKIHFAFNHFIQTIETSQSWIHIRLTGEFLEKYPNMITKTEFLDLLRILQKLNSESKDFSLKYQIYYCLMVLIRVERNYSQDFKQETQQLWMKFFESIISTINLSQKEEITYLLLQEALSKINTPLLASILKAFLSKNIQLGSHNIFFLYLILQDLNIISKETKLDVIKLILNEETTSQYLREPVTGKILIALCFQDWPFRETFKEKLPICEVSMLYKKILDLSLDKSSETDEKKIVGDAGLDSEILELLMHELDSFLGFPQENFQKLMQFNSLVVNVLDFASDLSIELEEESLLAHVKLNLNNFYYLLQAKKVVRENNYKEVLFGLEELKYLFALKANKYLTSLLREETSNELLKLLLGFVTDINWKESCKNLSDEGIIKNKVGLAAFTALVEFCIAPTNNLIIKQKQVLEVLLAQDLLFRCNEEDKYIQVIFSAVKALKPGDIPNDILELLLEFVRNICQDHYKIYNPALCVLRALYDLYPHFMNSQEEDLLQESIALLYPFYSRYEFYGHEVSFQILKCVEQLYSICPDIKMLEWDENYIISYMVKYLDHESVKIRFQATETIVKYFERIGKSCDINDFHKQEIIFCAISNMCNSVFLNNSSSGNSDLIVNKTASTLYLFERLMCDCPIWIESCIVTLFKLSVEYSIPNIKLVLKNISDFISRKYNKSFFDLYLENILSKWCSEGLEIDSFPFKFFNCDSKLNFYENYLDICFPIFIQNDIKDLTVASKNANISLLQIIERTVPKIISKIILEEIENIDCIGQNKLFQFLRDQFQTGFQDVLIEKQHEIIFCLLRLITDEKYIWENFQEKYIFFEKRLSLPQFQLGIGFLKRCCGESFGFNNLLKESHKLERLLRKMKATIGRAITQEERVKSFQQYAVLNNLILECLEPKNQFSVFFLRDTIYVCLQLLVKFKDDQKISQMVALFFKKFLKEIIPEYLGLLEEFFTIIVNGLKNLVVLKVPCLPTLLEVLNLLIVENCDYLPSCIESLDFFPETPEFDSMREVQNKLKSNKNSLKTEMLNFLQHYKSSSENSIIGLNRLKKVLIEQKHELNDILLELETSRGFSEDCSKSLLHKSVSTLFEFSLSSNSEVSLKSLSCLGEIGPVNLRSLILKPEKDFAETNFTPFQTICGVIISLLSRYIVDEDSNVVEVASEILYSVLQHKDGRHIASSAFDFGYGEIKKLHIAPFFTFKKQSGTSTRLNLNNFSLPHNVWCPSETRSYENWLITLTTAILKLYEGNCFLPKIVSICELKVEVCEELLPLLVYNSFLLDSNIASNMVSNIDYFFMQHWECTVKAPRESIATSQEAVKCMLRVVNFIRLSIASSDTRRKIALQLNYLNIGHAALFCASHFNALFYTELWCQQELEELREGKAKDLDGVNVLDLIYQRKKDVGQTLYGMLRKAYNSIGATDALSGCGTSFIMNPQFRVEHYKDLGQWDKVLHYYESNASRGLPSQKDNLFSSLKKCGFYNLPILCSQSSNEQQYECLWRLGVWDSGEAKNFNRRDDSPTAQDFEKYRYFALKSVAEKNFNSLAWALNAASKSIIERLSHTSLESTINLYPILAKIQGLNEINDFSKALQRGSFDTLLSNWKTQTELVARNSFEYLEENLSQRMVLLNSLLKREDRGLKGELVKMAINFADLGRKEKQFHIASKALDSLAWIDDLNEELQSEINICQAQICWANNDKLSAQHIFKQMSCNENISFRSRSMALKLHGQYLVETFSENRLVIIKDYFLKAIQEMQNEELAEEDNKNLLDIYSKLANFADREYQQTVEHMKSDLFIKKISHMNKARQTASLIRNQAVKTKDEQTAAAIHERQSNIDEIEIKNTQAEKNRFLVLALKYYIRNISYCDVSDIKIFRIMALFLENRNNNAVQEIIKELSKIPSYKFLIMLPQLIPHVNDTSLEFFNVQILEIIERCAKDHPHHTLPLILSLSNSYKDKEYTKQDSKASVNDVRVTTADNMLKKLSRMEALKNIIQEMKLAAGAFIELAYYDVGDHRSRGKECSIPRGLAIQKIKRFQYSACPIVNTPVRKNAVYDSIISIDSFKSTFKLAGGINMPKIISCRGSDGVNRTMLVKGRDDLRQDAVMQQVFTIMNNLLSKNRKTENLLIRTYKISPLSMRSGIVEWVDNSMTVGDYLAGENGNSGAHCLFRPRDMKPAEGRMKINNCAKSSPEEKLKVFKIICQGIKPVFHKFFETHFPQASIWYERRRAYIQSVATSSMCGYILGIGDRHVSNILIDKRTAELIHIDFGIAFEQGRCLPTPEAVPFRLTRDIVDGMGVCGVEGMFRSSCEKTMEVLRGNSQTIITILEVLLYDPLYAWTVSPTEAKKRQNDSSERSGTLDLSDEDNVSVNITAERALLRLRAKLLGTEEGNPVSIEHQVGTLIQQARDPANLCRMFHGWQAYL